MYLFNNILGISEKSGNRENAIGREKVASTIKITRKEKEKATGWPR